MQEATQKNIVINDISIKPGSTAQLNLNVYELPNKLDLAIPVYVFRSKNPGPTLLLLAGMHGDESNGIEIVRRLISDERVRKPKCGSVIAIPVLNIISFLSGARELPDGRDLNRCFPGSRNGSLGSKIAYDLMKEIVPQIDFGIDYHTGGAKITNYPQLRFVFDNMMNLELGKNFAPPFVVNSEVRENTFRKEASKRGKPILVYEGGESLRFDYFAISEGVNGCLRLMHHLNMVDKPDYQPHEPVFISKSTWLRAGASGLFHTQKICGSRVKIGDTLGVICDPFGEQQEEVVCTINGYIIGLNMKPIVNQGDALVHIGLLD